ncbi:MAG: STAS domain-containing protein [Acidobacteria bacterium]|nr:STAS domain-containing protein [Acidobacteriota bacterium]
MASSRQVDGVTVLDLSGRIVLGEGCEVLQEALADFVRQRRTKILLNLAAVSYVDSSGLGTIVSGYTYLRDRQGHLKLLNLPKKVRDLLQIAKLLTLFEVFDDENTAVQSFR